MNCKLCGRKRSWPNLIRLKGLSKSTKNLSQDTRSPGRDGNPEPLEYKARMLTTRPRRLVGTYRILKMEAILSSEILITT
jgi:hypothetical protein